MQHTPSDIKAQLLKTIDQHSNVVDMAGCIEAISILEQTTFTREDLEHTRLGKLVNELRKKTNNDELAKRAKKLVKSWQKLLPSSQHLQAAGVNGEKVAPGFSSVPASPSVENVSYSNPPSQLSRTSGSGSCSRLTSPAVPKSVSHSQSTVGLSSSAADISDGSKDLLITNANNKVIGQDLGVTNAANKKRRRKIVTTYAETGIVKKPMLDAKTDAINGVVLSTVNNDLKQSRSIDCMMGNLSRSDEFAAKASSDHSEFLQTDIDSSKPSKSDMQTKLPRLAKVKTTAQLIEELQAKTPTALNSPTISMITSHKIKDLTHEEDKKSVIPDSLKKRKYTRKNSTALLSMGADLSQTKAEMVEKFLESSLPGTSHTSYHEQTTTSPDLPRLDSPVASSPKAESRPKFYLNNSHSSSNLSENPTDEMLFDSIIGRPPVEPQTEAKVEHQKRPSLPPIDLSTVVLEEEEYEVMHEPVTESRVERLCNERWPGVNGWYDDRNEWHDWASCFSLPTHQNDYIHILPYVNIDD